MRLFDRIRRRRKAPTPEPDHPLAEEERQERPPESADDLRARRGEDYVGDDFDPAEPRSGRV